MRELDGVIAVVTGVARGFGRAVAEAMIDAGARVVGVGTGSAGLVRALGAGFVAEPEPLGPEAREELLRRHDPQLLVITTAPALADPDRRLDPREAFEWTAAALRVPLTRGAEGALILAVSGESPEDAVGCGGGVPLGALTAYVAWQARREKVRLRFVSVLVPPGVGTRLEPVVEQISARSDLSALLAGLRPALTEVELGADVVRLAALACAGYTRPGDGDHALSAGLSGSYELTAQGLVPFPAPPATRHASPE